MRNDRDCSDERNLSRSERDEWSGNGILVTRAELAGEASTVIGNLQVSDMRFRLHIQPAVARAARIVGVQQSEPQGQGDVYKEQKY
jgi:hypothetical protein